MAEYVLQAGKKTPDKIALEVLGSDRKMSHGALRNAVRSMAGQLLSIGLSPGDSVLFRLDSCVEFPIAYLACIYVGLVPVPLSSQLTSREVTVVTDMVGGRLILHSPGVSLPEKIDCPVLSVSDLNMENIPSDLEPRRSTPHAHAYTIFTSGTSCTPRGVRHAHRAVWARQIMFEGWYGLQSSDRLLHAGAFNWTYTLGTGLVDPWTIGATALIPAAGTPAKDLPTLLGTHDVTIFAAAPGVYRQMLADNPTIRADQLRHGLSAGEKMPARTRAAWVRATGTDVHEALGMSECSTFISGAPGVALVDGASGRPQTGRRVAVLEGGKPVGYNTAGELAVHKDDPGLMIGYLNQPEGAHLTGDWFMTGDLVSMSATGDVTYLGRADDMMNAGGVRVSPLEVEAAFADHPSVGDVAATAVTVKADVTVIALFHTGPANDLADRAETHLATYKRPRLYIRKDVLPKGPNGKLNRRALARDYEAEHGQT